MVFKTKLTDKTGNTGARCDQGSKINIYTIK